MASLLNLINRATDEQVLSALRSSLTLSNLIECEVNRAFHYEGHLSNTSDLHELAESMLKNPELMVNKSNENCAAIALALERNNHFETMKLGQFDRITLVYGGVDQVKINLYHNRKTNYTASLNMNNFETSIKAAILSDTNDNSFFATGAGIVVAGITVFGLAVLSKFSS